MDGSYIMNGSSASCFSIPKWACPYVGGVIGLGANWAAAKYGGTKAGQVAGVFVGVSVSQICGNLAT